MLSFIWKTIIGRFIVLITLCIIAIFVACSLNPFLNLDALLGAGFLGIVFPYALLAMLICFVLTLILKPRWSIVVLIVLALNWKQIFVCIAPNIHKPVFAIFKPNDKNTIRILNWNVRRFLPEKTTNIYNSKFTKEHQSLINSYQPDIICLQEFLIHDNKDNNIKEAISTIVACGYPYYYFSKDYQIDEVLMSGNIIFSKFKIFNKHVTRFEKIEAGSESMMYVDIETPANKSIRIFTTHLESYGFKAEEYKKIKLIKDRKDKQLLASRDIFFKMRNTFLLRKQQCDIIKTYLESTPMPYILSGDFNDVPNSYTYFTLCDNMKDAFIEKGYLLGSTYPHLLPTLRIDYILASKNFIVKQFENIPTTLSDHNPIVADLVIK